MRTRFSNKNAIRTLPFRASTKFQKNHVLFKFQAISKQKWKIFFKKKESFPTELRYGSIKRSVHLCKSQRYAKKRNPSQKVQPIDKRKAKSFQNSFSLYNRVWILRTRFSNKNAFRTLPFRAPAKFQKNLVWFQFQAFSKQKSKIFIKKKRIFPNRTTVRLYQTTRAPMQISQIRWKPQS